MLSYFGIKILIFGDRWLLTLVISKPPLVMSICCKMIVVAMISTMARFTGRRRVKCLLPSLEYAHNFKRDSSGLGFSLQIEH